MPYCSHCSFGLPIQPEVSSCPRCGAKFGAVWKQLDRSLKPTGLSSGRTIFKFLIAGLLFLVGIALLAVSLFTDMGASVLALPALIFVSVALWVATASSDAAFTLSIVAAFVLLGIAWLTMSFIGTAIYSR